MAGNKAGAEKRRQTMIKKFGSEEAYIAFMKKLGSKGGSEGGRGGFAMMPKHEVRKHARAGGRKRWSDKQDG